MTAPLPNAVGHRLRVHDAELNALSMGNGSPIVLVHGWPLDLRVFEPQIAELASAHRVIAYDRRGFGRSLGEPDLERELDDLDVLIDTLAGGPVHLLGMSQGGRLALRYAASRPDKLRSLIVQGAVMDGLAIEESPWERIPLDRYAELVRQGRLAELRARWLDHPMMSIGAGRGDVSELLGRILDGYEGRDLLASEAQAPAFRLYLGDVVVPVLVITGAHETPARQQHAKALIECLLDARQVVLADAGHLCNLTAPAAYNAAVKEFLAAVDDGTAAVGSE